MASIKSARVLHTRSMLAKTMFLEVATTEEVFTFGMNPPPDLLPSLPFPVTALQGRIGWSLSSRLILLAWFLWLIYQQLKEGV